MKTIIIFIFLSILLPAQIQKVNVDTMRIHSINSLIDKFEYSLIKNLQVNNFEQAKVDLSFLENFYVILLEQYTKYIDILQGLESDIDFFKRQNRRNK